MAKATERPESLEGHTHRIRTNCGNLFVTANTQDGKLVEVFIRMGKQGSCMATFNETIGRLLSVALQEDIEIQKLTKQLSSLQCAAGSSWNEGEQIRSCSDAISKVLTKYISKEEPK